MSTLNINDENFQKEVMESEKPVLLDFWAPWCGPCRMVSPVIDEVAGEIKGVKVVKINVDEQPAIAGKFGVMSIPTLVVIKNGKVVDSSVGVKPKEHIIKMLEK
ncbi:MAG TPA: thioredoxin [Lachnospiraceae bacterium]|nr:thioredoxin [Lachnospiraceae bacterium]